MVVDISEARKLLQEICPERITDNSLIWTLLLSQASGLDASERKTAPAVDYFSSIDFFQGPNTTKASLDLEHHDAAAVPERVSVASISGLNQEPVTTGEADRHSDAATLSEWGLDRLFDGNESSSQQQSQQPNNIRTRKTSAGTLASNLALYRQPGKHSSQSAASLTPGHARRPSAATSMYTPSLYSTDLLPGCKHPDQQHEPQADGADAQRSDDASMADTLSEWGLDNLFNDNHAAAPGQSKWHSRTRTKSGASSLAASVALYRGPQAPISTTPDFDPPSDEQDLGDAGTDDWQSDGEQASHMEPVKFDDSAPRPRPRKVSAAASIATQSSTGFSRAATPADDHFPSRPPSALSKSRFDPGRTASHFSSMSDYQARQELLALRPRFTKSLHPNGLVMPLPLATAEDMERARLAEMQRERDKLIEQQGDLCSIPSLRSSDDEVSDDDGEDEEQAGKEKQEKEKDEVAELEELAVSRKPAGKLFGRSLMDDLADRQAKQKAKIRVFHPDDGRVRMNDAVPGETLIEKRERQFAEDAEPWNRYSVANFQTLMAQHPETVEEQQQQRPPMPKSHSVFGPDKIMQSELAKLEKILKMEEAEKKMQAERDRIAELDKQAKEAKRTAKQQAKEDKRRKWRQSRMLDDALVPDHTSVKSHPSMVEVDVKHPDAEPEDYELDNQVTIQPMPMEDDEDEEDEEPYHRRASVAPSLTLSHLDLNNHNDKHESGLGAFLKRSPSSDEDSSSSSDGDDDDPWANRRDDKGASKKFDFSKNGPWDDEKPREPLGQISLPKFEFDTTHSDHEKQDESEQSDSEDERPLRAYARPRDASEPHSSENGRTGASFPSSTHAPKLDFPSTAVDSDEEDEVPLAQRARMPRISHSSGRSHKSSLKAIPEDEDVPLAVARARQGMAPHPPPIAEHQGITDDSSEDEAPLGLKRPPQHHHHHQQQQHLPSQVQPAAGTAGDSSDDEAPLGLRQPPHQQRQQNHPAQADEVQRMLALAEQQQNYYFATQQQDMMFQQMWMQQQQQQQHQHWAMMQAMQQQQMMMMAHDETGSMVEGGGSYTPHVPSEKLTTRVDNWRSGVE